MAWELRPSIAGTAGAGLFLALTFVTSVAHADARPAKLSMCDAWM